MRNGPNLDIHHIDILDSGFTTAPYPSPSLSGDRFPTLARKGAGLL
jgi:hypothetical protein